MIFGDDQLTIFTMQKLLTSHLTSVPDLYMKGIENDDSENDNNDNDHDHDDDYNAGGFDGGDEDDDDNEEEEEDYEIKKMR